MPRTRPLSLSKGELAQLREVAHAIADERRASERPQKLACTAVHAVTAEPGLYRLEVERLPDADWTWEGARVVQHCPGLPAHLTSVPTGRDDLHEIGIRGPEKERAWQGEVLQVDELANAIYVDGPDPELEPTPGELIAHPFDFLAALDAVYGTAPESPIQERLCAALRAAQGGARPRGLGAAVSGRAPEPSGLWNHAWSILWGPPGTGKTYTIGNGVAERLRGQPSERVLLVSPTNRATDGAVLEVGRALRKLGREPDSVGVERARLLRRARQLVRHLQGNTLAPMLERRYRLVACTCFAALRMLQDPAVALALEQQQAPFHTVILDEAGLVSRAAAAALSLLAANRFLLVGDPRQLAPISRVARLLPSHQARWLSESALGHLDIEDAGRPGVQFLREQHRMLPEIRRVVSRYLYADQLQDSRKVVVRETLDWHDLDPPLQGQPRALWYVLDEDTTDPAAIRASRGPRGRSWRHEPLTGLHPPCTGSRAPRRDS